MPLEPGDERQQVGLEAVSLDDLIPLDHLARPVWRLVANFNLEPLLDRIAAPEGVAGHPQTDPAILVSLWLYATLGDWRTHRLRCAGKLLYRQRGRTIEWINARARNRGL